MIPASISVLCAAQPGDPPYGEVEVPRRHHCKKETFD